MITMTVHQLRQALKDYDGDTQVIAEVNGYTYNLDGVEPMIGSDDHRMLYDVNEAEFFGTDSTYIPHAVILVRWS